MNINSWIHYFYELPYVSQAIHWILFGLISGVAAKVILPGQENLGWLRTIGVGILGAFLGGFLANYMGYHVNIGWNLVGMLTSIGGAVILLLLNRVVTRS